MVKLCECGCGQPTSIAPRSYWKWGYIRGKPVRFIRGHATRGKKYPPEIAKKMGNKATRFKKGHKPYTDGKNLIGLQASDKHWNWKGGITPETIRLRGTKKYIEWRTKVFKRDDYTCQMCGKRGVYIEADHYPIPFTKIFADKNWEVMWDIRNGRTLCRKCHDGTKTNWRDYYLQPNQAV